MQDPRAGTGPDPSAPAYVIDYIISFRGALEAGRLFQAQIYRWWMLINGSGVLVGAVISLSYPALGLAIAGGCIALLLMARFAIADRILGRRQLRTLIGRRMELAIGDDGIDWTSPLGSGHLPWASITEIRANPRTVLFVGDRLLLAYAPSDAFTSPSERDEVTEYARSCVAKAAARQYRASFSTAARRSSVIVTQDIPPSMALPDLVAAPGRPATLVTNRSMPEAAVIPELAYSDVTEAADWICRAFGFRPRLRIGDHRVQLVFGDGAVIVTRSGATPPDSQMATHSVLVRVEDADRHHDQALRAGARILQPPTDYPYGERQYTAEDPGGRRWTFSQSIADVDPTTWGGTPVEVD